MTLRPPTAFAADIERCHEVAKQTGSRAYTFTRPAGSTSLLEVRVWPNGAWTITPVDDHGRPAGKPQRSFRRPGR